MGRNKKHIHKDLEDFLDYSGNRMTHRERNAFEKDLQKDAFGSDAAEGLSTISREEALEDMKELNIRLTRRTTHSNRFILYRVAAAIAAVLVVSSLILLFTGNLNRIFEQAAVTENKRSAKEKILREEEKSEPVTSEESLTKTEVPLTTIPSADRNKTITGIKRQDSEIISEISEAGIDIEEPEGETKPGIITEEKEKQITEEIADNLEIKENIYLVKAEEDIETGAGNEAFPAVMAKKSESTGSERIITRKYIDNYVRGVVISSEDQLPLPGATVKIKGTTAGTYTDQHGNFELPVIADTSITLVAEFIGMEQNEVRLGDSENVQIMLEPSETDLDEVVVIGYGVQKISNVTGAIAVMEMDDHPDYQPPSPVTGNRQFKEYIEENMRYPASDTTGLRVVVVLNFTIGENGRPKNISPLKSPGKQFTEEAIRLLVNGPDWYPARRNGEIVEEETMIRIVFRPDYK